MTVSDDRKLHTLFMFTYVTKRGSKITWRKCCFDPKNLCDMTCPSFKLKIIPQVTLNGRVYHAVCFCAKFEPPVELEEFKIHPLNEEEET